MELALLDKNLPEIPAWVEDQAESVKTLNLTGNALEKFKRLNMFTNLDTLILDKNGLTNLEGCPRMESVRTLWCNNNYIQDVETFLTQAQKSFPNITKLSVMRNPASPPMVCLSEEDVAAMERHRLYVIYRLPQLMFLDSSPIKAEERREAKRRGQFLAVRKPPKKRNSMSESSRHTGELRGRTGSMSSVGSNQSMPAQTNKADNVWSALDGGLTSADSHGGADNVPPEERSSYAQSFSDEFSDGEHEEKQTKKPTAFLRVETTRYDGKHSEGNRFILDQHL
eukprot:gb/GECG01003408.1/.p1 GENE.gb/GECG01003408.1/~~gb/GECG01003408.1/.p1  ORF type:complete len:282 (+),score=34.60 gb/GECG01003408.1/:1-846(+)